MSRWFSILGKCLRVDIGGLGNKKRQGVGGPAFVVSVWLLEFKEGEGELKLRLTI